jgi:Flp pilus assembly protein TadD
VKLDSSRNNKMSVEYDINEMVQQAAGLQKDGKLLEAKEIYERIIALNPNHFAALQLLGLTCSRLGQFDQAVDAFLKAIATNGQSAFAHKNLGNAFEDLGRLDSALASYDRAITILPGYAAAYNDRGNLFKKLNRLDDAIANYNKTIALKQDYVEAYNNLGVTLNEAKRHVEALTNFEKAIQLRSDFVAARRNYAVAVADLAQWRLLRRYRAVFGVFPRLHPPVSFNERILQRIIYDRDPRLRILCDKLAVRGFIEDRVGKEYVVPLLGVWERAKEISWDSLPDKFVLKPSHASGRFAIVERPVDADPEKLIAEAEEWLSHDFFAISLEWGYRGLSRRILAEPFLCSPDGSPAQEAHVYTFSGRAALFNIFIGTKRSPERSSCWYDVTGRRVGITGTGPHPDIELPDGERLAMIEIAERVSQGFSSLRVDFYLISNGLKIGELTPYTLGGIFRWHPPEMDEKLGQLWNPDFNLSIIPDHK